MLSSIDERFKSKSPAQVDQPLLSEHNNQFTEYTLEGEPSRLKPKHFVYLCASLACLSSILVGYDIGIMSGAIVYMKRDLGLTQWRTEVIVSSLNLFWIPGALFGGHIAHIIGRKKTIAIAAVIFFIGALLIVATKVYGIIVFGRVLLGIAAGTGILIAPLYTAELSPAAMRGKLGTFVEISINVGILSGYLIAWLFSGIHNDDVAWRVMISVGILPAVILFSAMLIMPESPRWLIEQGMENKAYNVLRNVYGNKQTMIIHEINDIKNTIKLETAKSKEGFGSNKCGGWLDVLWPHNAYIKRALLIGIGVSFFQQASGNEAAVYYTPHIFEKAGIDKHLILLYTIFVGISKVAFIFVSTFFLDKVGRRPLLLASAGCMTFSIFGLALAFGIDSSVLTIIFQCCFTASFSIGWGPIAGVIVSEIFPLRIRSKAMSICFSVSGLLSGTVALTFLSLQDVLGVVGVWVMFGSISALAIVFIYIYVPETKQKTLEEITKFLMREYKTHTSSDVRKELGNYAVTLPFFQMKNRLE